MSRVKRVFMIPENAIQVYDNLNDGGVLYTTVGDLPVLEAHVFITARKNKAYYADIGGILWVYTLQHLGRGVACETIYRCGDDENLVVNICASDGKSYANECIMQQHACRAKTFLSMLHEGTCTQCQDDSEIYQYDSLFGQRNFFIFTGDNQVHCFQSI